MANWAGWWLAAQVAGVEARHWAAYRIERDEGGGLETTVVAPATSAVAGRTVWWPEANVLANLHHGHLVLWETRPDWLVAGLLEGERAGEVGDGDHGGEPAGPASGHIRGATDAARQPV